MQPGPPGAPPLEVWGGIEATIVRIGGHWRNQVTETGHHVRPGDLGRIASLGISTLRYPILWESVSPERSDVFDWSWHDARLRRLRGLGVQVIAGLLHHGSGPGYTDLLDPFFAEKLAVHAAATAARYPWIERFTPVNEPLTTARFSALYGHWYPHHQDERSFLRALVNQCRGVVLSMQAIRRITPSAQLIQTEDLGKTFSTPLLDYQAEFENERRWLSFDLLCGRVGKAHPLRNYMVRMGVTEADLRFFQEHACPPDILGMNHYPTSERYLDERSDLFCPSSHGGNGRHTYADVEAIRMGLPAGSVGPQPRLQELWDRYRRPVAVTEAHHGCTREEQLRWLMEVWRAALAVRQAGADVRAVTPWALLGVVDWRSLLLRRDGIYEAGAFDIRSFPPRRTILGAAIRSLAQRQDFDHPVLEGPGWWRRDERLYAHVLPVDPAPIPEVSPLLISGAGRLAGMLAQCCAGRGLPVVLWPTETRSGQTAAQALREYRPWAVIGVGSHGSYAPQTGGAACQDGYAVCSRALDSACDGAEIPLATFYFEAFGDPPGQRHRGGRPGFPFGLMPSEEQGFRAAQPRHKHLILLAGHLLKNGRLVSPAWLHDHVHDLLNAALDLLVDGETGLWHLSGPDGKARPAADARSLKPVCFIPFRGRGAPRRAYPLPDGFNETPEDSIFSAAEVSPGP